MEIFGKVTKVGDEKQITPSVNNVNGNVERNDASYSVRPIEVKWYVPLNTRNGLTYKEASVAIELRHELVRTPPMVGDMIAVDCDCYSYSYTDRSNLETIATRLVANRLVVVPSMSNLTTRTR